MNYKIRIESPEHSEKVQKHLFSLGYTWAEGVTDVMYTDAKFIVFDITSKIIYFVPFYRIEKIAEYQEVELIEKVSYEFKEVPKREVVTIGEKSYYKDELEVALKNINPI
jgi:hypothetical protein